MAPVAFHACPRRQQQSGVRWPPWMVAGKMATDVGWRAGGFHLWSTRPARPAFDPSGSLHARAQPHLHRAPGSGPGPRSAFLPLLLRGGTSARHAYIIGFAAVPPPSRADSKLCVRKHAGKAYMPAIHKGERPNAVWSNNACTPRQDRWTGRREGGGEREERDGPRENVARAVPCHADPVDVWRR